jgi:methionyl-tRNA formyltransferase
VAWEREIPVLAINRPEAPATRAALAALQPDLACVACFSLRIPPSLLTLPPLGFLNLHPSLLPAYRGPAPLFWIFRQGEYETGVTVHFMNEGLDAGDIALQARVEAPDGISGAAADALYAARGGELLVEAVQRLQNGVLSRQPQPAGGSYHPRPTAADFHITVTWPARRAFNFMRGTVEWNQPYIVEAGEERVTLRSAVAYTAGGTLDRPLVRRERDVWLQFTPGILHAIEQ